MDVCASLKLYLARILESDKNNKILFLDDHTSNVISVLTSLIDLLKKNVIHVENIKKFLGTGATRGKIINSGLTHIDIIFILSPSSICFLIEFLDSISQYMQYDTIKIYFTESITREQLKDIASHDKNHIIDEIIEMYINQNFKKYQKSSQFGKFLIWIFYIHHYKHFLKNSFVAHKTRHPQSLGVVAFHTDARGPGHEPQRHCHSPTHCFQQPHRASERMGFNRLLLSHRSSRTPRHPQNQKRQGPPLPHQRRSHDPKQRDGIDKAPAGSFFPRCSVILHDVTKRHFKGFCASNPKDNHGNNKQHRDDLSSKTGGVAFSRKDQ